MTFEAEISGLFIDRKNGEPVFMLKEQNGSRTVPIWVDMNDLFSVALQLSNGKVELPRPFSHDLIKTVLLNIQAQVQQVVITGIEDYIYQAQITVASPEKTLKFDVRPSDAIVLALKFDAPICVVEEVADKQKALIHEAGLTEESLLQRFQELQIEDVINLSA